MSPLLKANMDKERIRALRESLAEVFSEPALNLEEGEQPSSPLDQTGLTEMFSQPFAISNDPKSSPPGLDHHALAAVFEGVSSLSIDAQSNTSPCPGLSSLPFANPTVDQQPLGKSVTGTTSTDKENTRPQRAKALLAELRYIFSAKADARKSSVESILPPLATSTDQPGTGTEDIASPSSAGDVWSSPPNLLPTQPLATNTETPSASQQQLAAARDAGPPNAAPDDVREPFLVVPEAIRRSPWAPSTAEELLPATSQASPVPDQPVRPLEKPSLTTAKTVSEDSTLRDRTYFASKPDAPLLESFDPIQESAPLHPTLATRPDDARLKKPEEKPAEHDQALTEYIEPLPPVSTDQARPQPAFTTELSRPGQPHNLQAPVAPVNTGTQRAESVVTDQSLLTSINPAAFHSLPLEMTPRPATLVEPEVVDAVAQIAAIDAESAKNQQEIQSRPEQKGGAPADAALSTCGLYTLGSEHPPGARYPDELDNGRLAEKAGDDATAPDAIARSQTDTSPQQELSLTYRDPHVKVVTSLDVPLWTAFCDRIDEPRLAGTAIAAADVDSTKSRSQQAKSLLAALGLDTAIRMKWIMRDIRAKRTAVPPASDKDFAILIDLGLVEMQENSPSLTVLGLLALD